MCDREMTLNEWCKKLPSNHAVNNELSALRAMVAKFSTSHNTERDVICSCKGMTVENMKLVSECNFKHCPWCGRKLSPVS